MREIVEWLRARAVSPVEVVVAALAAIAFVAMAALTR
jgi:hypothetical protein